MNDNASNTEFVQLIRDFLDRRVSSHDFCALFIRLWVRNRDSTYSSAEPWKTRSFAMLQDAWRRGELSPDAFRSESQKLWGYDIEFRRLVDTVHSACSVFYPEPQQKEIGEEQLRRDVEAALSEYLSAGEQTS
jgi:hypothetical protein